jgi:hypothetical protein
MLMLVNANLIAVKTKGVDALLAFSLEKDPTG